MIRGSIILLISALFTITAVESRSLPFFGKKEYTPLVFFKVPKGTSPECDEMEKIISSVEKELKVKVQRFDILRDRFARNLFEKVDQVDFVGKIPLLYHRESRQTLYGLDAKSRVRAWAKGRWLSPKMADERGASKKFVADEEEQQEEMEFIEDDLTELQQLGREKIMERMNESE
mmetsp:Transcript_14675/g.17864  ORF Transcript_14675/g.17864 Transcript_14675/m.17864 type:complete len:175 (-) Transcript_14675:26-550(-)